MPEAERYDDDDSDLGAGDARTSSSTVEAFSSPCRAVFTSVIVAAPW
jgi:hypothetical protein